MKYILIIFIALFCFSSCSANYEYLSVKNVQNSEVLTLHKNLRQGNIYALSVIGSGHIDGDAKLILILNGEPYETENLSGKIEFRWGGDWYTDSAKIRYKPESVKEGKLQIKYLLPRPKYRIPYHL